jgi:hypothetical protein
MKTILLTNCDNIFGTTLVKGLIGKHNILQLAPNKCLIDRVRKIEYIHYTYSNYKELNVGVLINEINAIISHTNNMYDGINVCVDCKEGNVNYLDLQTLLLHHYVITNSIKREKECQKIIYNNNKLMPKHINDVYPGNITAYNCNSDVLTAMELIEETHKFSTKTKTPYFDFKYEPVSEISLL